MLEQRNYSNTLGSYMPAFFYMNLNFPYYNTRTTLYNLRPKELSTFVHEYIHFLQDISSYSLLNNAYVYSEYMHAAANYLYKQPIGDFSVPLNLPFNFENVGLNRFINSTCMGNFRNVDNIFIIDIVYKQIKVPYSSFVDKLIIPFLQLANGTKLVFGTCAIMESMAYLMESLITKGSTSPPEYPYLSAEYVVKKEYPDFAKDTLNIIALCDIALQFSNPGYKFVSLLRSMKKNNYLPPTPEELYELINKKTCMLLGKRTTLPMALIEMGRMVQDRLKLYLNDSHFKDFHDTIRDFIGFGIAERLRCPHFMIELVRDGYALYNKSLLNIVNQVGSPLIIDSEYNFTHLPAAGKTANESFQYFLAVEELYKCFCRGNTICEMYDFCNTTVCNAKDLFGDDWQNEQPIMDDNCWESPWLKVDDQRLCPYALLWKHWKLRGRYPKSNDIN